MSKNSKQSQRELITLELWKPLHTDLCNPREWVQVRELMDWLLLKAKQESGDWQAVESSGYIQFEDPG